VASDNARLNGVTVRFINGSLFEPFGGERFDLIVSNPPYIPLGAIPRAVEVQLHDPDIALYGGADGLDIVRSIAQLGRTLGRPGAQLMLEHGELQGESIRAILSEAGWRAAATHRDLVGRDRYTTATL
jgi:release factor glutamine methyltransferase